MKLPEKIKIEQRMIGEMSLDRSRFDDIEEKFNELIDYLGVDVDSTPQTAWEDFDQVWNDGETFALKSLAKKYIQNLLSHQHSEFREMVELLRKIPVEIPHGSPYLSGYNDAIKDCLSKLNTRK